MRNPHFGLWPKDDDPADKRDKRAGGRSVQNDLPERETIKELKAHRRLLCSEIKAMREKAFTDFLKGNEKAMHEIKKIENKINLINQTIRQLMGR